MSTYQTFLTFDISSLSAFNAWGAAISALLDTCGFTKTSDTGQVNWSTNTTQPTGSFPSSIFEIRQPASDPLQTGSTAYYLKVEYGSTQSATSNPNLRFAIGTATNGAGALTSSVAGPFATSQLSSAPLNAGTGITWESDASYTISSLAALFWRNITTITNNGAAFLGIERTKATDGTDNSDGVTLVVVGFVGAFQQTLVFGMGVANSLSRIPTLDAGTTSSLAFSSNIPISPVFPSYGKIGNPMTILAGATQGDVIEGALVSSTLYGVPITYLGSRAGGIVKLGSSAAQALLMRWQ